MNDIELQLKGKLVSKESAVSHIYHIMDLFDIKPEEII